jgi:hypothetical protein
VDYQVLFNISVGIIGTIGGWFLHTFYGSIRELQNADFRLNEEIHKVSLLIAGDYAKQSDLEKFESKVLDKIQALDDRIDKRMEKMEEKLEYKFHNGAQS